MVQILGRIRDKTGLLNAAGALLVRTSQQSFVDQRLGDKVWPHRYQYRDPEPFVNVAGVVADFRMGRTRPPNRRFERRPALSDTGRLRQSVSYRVFGGDSVEAGSAVPYAAKHQHGGKETQPIDVSTKERLWAWLKGQDKPMKQRLGFLLNKNVTELETKVHKRPFVGVTDRDADEMTALTEEWVAG